MQPDNNLLFQKRNHHLFSLMSFINQFQMPKLKKVLQHLIIMSIFANESKQLAEASSCFSAFCVHSYFYDHQLAKRGIAAYTFFVYIPLFGLHVLQICGFMKNSLTIMFRWFIIMTYFNACRVQI